MCETYEMHEQKDGTHLLSNAHFLIRKALSEWWDVWMSEWRDVGMVGCRNGGMSEWRDFGMGVATQKRQWLGAGPSDAPAKRWMKKNKQKERNQQNQYQQAYENSTMVTKYYKSHKVIKSKQEGLVLSLLKGNHVRANLKMNSVRIYSNPHSPNTP